MAAARSADGVILGPCDSFAYPPREAGGVNLSSAFRVGLDLYANVRPVKSYYPFVADSHPTINLVVVRENEEDLYAGIEHRQ